MGSARIIKIQGHPMIAVAYKKTVTATVPKLCSLPTPATSAALVVQDDHHKVYTTRLKINLVAKALEHQQTRLSLKTQQPNQV